MHRSPSSHGFVFAAFPTYEFRKDANARFKIEGKRSLVLKDNLDDVVVGRKREFHFGNGLAFGRREFENALVWSGFLSCA